jgi:branched-chain amino acid transport system substrate-binding protein
LDGNGNATNHQDAVAAIEASGSSVDSYIGVGTTPRNLAFGEGGLWILNADDRTVSRIDPESKEITKTFAIGTTPTEIAVGAGAVWIGNGPAKEQASLGNSTVSISRIDPDSAAVTHKLVLPRPRSKAYLSSSAYGVGQMAIGAGAVWAINPDLTVSRIDPATGKLLATITDTAITPSSAIAAGKEGVWVIGQGASVTRIDERRNRTGQTIRFVATPYLSGIAVGGGAVWATVPEDGVVWRIEPGPRPLTRTVEVGFGVTNITFAEGALWATNFIDGTVSRIDPRTNTVTRRVRVGGTPQGIAVGAAAAWVSVAGATARGALPDSACGPIESGGREPDVLIASDLPLQGFASTATRSMTDAIRFVLQKDDFMAGNYAVGYASCDHSTARTGGFDFFKCSSNGRSLAQTNRLVAVIGPYDSDCAQVEIMVSNRTSNGELAMVSPATTYSGLTRGGPGAWAHRTDPTRYYPTGKRTFMRIPPAQDLQLAASALLVKRLGFDGVFFLYSSGPWGVSASRSFAASARKVGLTVLGSRPWDSSAREHSALAGEVERSGARVVLLDGLGFLGGSQVVRDLRNRLGREVVLVGGEGFSPIPDLLRVAGRSAHGMYVLSPSLPAEALDRAGRRFVHEFGATHQRIVRAQAPQAAQAAEAVLQAISSSDGTRASVLAELRKIRVRNGVLGTFGFDGRGDVVPARMAVYRVTGKSGGRAPRYEEFAGAVLERVITVPARLRD